MVPVRVQVSPLRLRVGPTPAVSQLLRVLRSPMSAATSDYESDLEQAPGISKGPVSEVQTSAMELDWTKGGELRTRRVDMLFGAGGCPDHGIILGACGQRCSHVCVSIVSTLVGRECVHPLVAHVCAFWQAAGLVATHATTGTVMLCTSAVSHGRLCTCNDKRIKV